MTNEMLMYIFKNVDLEKKLTDTAYHATCGDDKYIILLDENGERVGGIYYMGRYDLHPVIFPQYRGQHHMSNFLRSGILKKVWRDVKYVTLENYNMDEDWDDECRMQLHLVKLGRLKLTYKSQWKIEQDRATCTPYVVAYDCINKLNSIIENDSSGKSPDKILNKAIKSMITSGEYTLNEIGLTLYIMYQDKNSNRDIKYDMHTIDKAHRYLQKLRGEDWNVYQKFDPCPGCEGTGHKYYSKNEPCSWCRGTGYSRIYDEH